MGRPFLHIQVTVVQSLLDTKPEILRVNMFYEQRRTWHDGDFIPIAAVQPHMAKEQPLLPGGHMCDVHQLHQPVRICSLGIVAELDVCEGATCRCLDREGCYASRAEGGHRGLERQKLALSCRCATFVPQCESSLT